MTMAGAALHASLGISAKSIHAGRKPKAGGDFTAKLTAKAERFQLQRIAQSLCFDSAKPAEEQFRVCWCHRTITSATGDVGVYRAEDGSGARMAGLSTCGSVWHCPVCAAKIAESRREELQAGMVAHCRSGGAAYLVTLTFPHEADHELAFILERFDKARQAFKNGRTYKRILGKEGSAGVAGVVSSLECTVSLENGWHPHLHMLVFAQRQGLGEVRFDGTLRQADNGDLESDLIDNLKGEWVRLLLKHGLGDRSKLADMAAHALNVRGGEFAAEYIAKFGRDERWGQSRELTSQHAKLGAAGKKGDITHFTPFQLLGWAGNGDGWAANRFREYAREFEGKRMITWSPGLKKALLGLEVEKTDEDLAADPLPDEKRIGEVSEDQLKVLISRNRMGDFLRYVAQSAYGQADIDEYINAIRGIPADWGGQRRIRRTFGGGFNVVH